MFFKYRILNVSEKKIAFTPTTELATEGLAYADFIESALTSAIGGDGDAIERLEWKIGFSSSVRKKIGAAYQKNKEAYAIVLGKVTRVFAASQEACIYAAATLSLLAKGGELFEGFIYDLPIAPERGFRVFLPARAGFEDFYRMVDFLATYKFNSIILEVGGAMEYRRHPKINETWAEFCRDMHRYSGRSHEIQTKTYPWHKNSIHCDNAGGDILTQDEVRTLIAYCRSRGLSVMPECPLLSHADYLVMAYPEIREREGDMHPDSYCPNHPDTYKYVFDILEEVIDVFRPEAVHIGHDEAYSVGVCPRCKNTKPHILYANDIIKIHDFLAERGIKTYMWGEKLINGRGKNQRRIGGAGHGKGDAHVPSLWPCRDLLPSDLNILHWFWHRSSDYDNVFLSRGMHTVFGNLEPLLIKEWNMRRDRGVNGGYVSNWGAFDTETMQKNCMYIKLFSSAYAFWCEDFEARGAKSMYTLCFEEAYRLCLNNLKTPLTVTHTTPHRIPYEAAWDGVFITDEKYLLGRYHLTYADGTEATLPVRYGSHIGSSTFTDAIDNIEFRQLAYGVLPLPYRDGFAYRVLYEDPHPDKELLSIVYRPREDRADIPVSLIGFHRGGDEAIKATIEAKIRREADCEDGIVL